ncbi:MAG TPA: hypothetical protein VJZ91_19345, partial [Blastocatellia bacterium]|nr:hypothetical protein [Blastocatellia bacterium]
KVQIEVEDGQEIIEIRGRDEKGELTLAAHLLEYDESGLKAAHRSVKLAGGAKFSFTISAPGHSVEQTPAAVLTLTYEAASPTRSLWAALKQMGERLKGSLTARGWRFRDVVKSPLAIALLTCAAILAVYLRIQREGQNRPAASGTEESTASKNETTNSTAPHPLGQKQVVNRNAGSAAPATPAANRDRAKNPGEEKAATDSTHPRSLGEDEAAASLKAVQHVFIHLRGTEPLSQQVRERLAVALAAGNRLTVVEERAAADALLECVARPSLKGPRAVSLDVQLINEGGKIIWPLTKRRYTGEVAEVTARIARDLLADIEKSEHKQ